MVSQDSLNFSKGEEFEKAILQTIDSVLKKVLGGGAANVIIIYAKKSVPSKWEEDPERVKVFVEALRNLIGISSKIVELMILKNLYSTFDLNFEEKKTTTFLIT